MGKGGDSVFYTGPRGGSGDVRSPAGSCGSLFITAAGEKLLHVHTPHQCPLYVNRVHTGLVFWGNDA